jgi:hypothetical protein
MIKKAKRNELEPWFVFAKHLLQQNDINTIRQLLRRALQCTEKRKRKNNLIFTFYEYILDLALIKGLARLEAQYGDIERSKTMQELIKNYKDKGRIDIQSLEGALGAKVKQN